MSNLHFTTILKSQRIVKMKLIINHYFPNDMSKYVSQAWHLVSMIRPTFDKLFNFDLLDMLSNYVKMVIKMSFISELIILPNTFPVHITYRTIFTDVVHYLICSCAQDSFLQAFLNCGV